MPRLPAPSSLVSGRNRSRISAGRRRWEGERRYRVARDPAMQRRVQSLAQRLARHSGLDLREVNAFALPAATPTSPGAPWELARSDSARGGVLAWPTRSRRSRADTASSRRRRPRSSVSASSTWSSGGRGVGASLANLGARMVRDVVCFKYSRAAEREADREGSNAPRLRGPHHPLPPRPPPRLKTSDLRPIQLPV